MKLFLYVMLVLTTALLTTACSPPNHMLVKDQPLQDFRAVVPDKGKAALVVARPTILAVHMPISTYLDKSFIGALKGKMYFVKTDVAPGSHYITTKWTSAQFAPVKILFKADEVYYLQQIPAFGGYVAVTPMDQTAEWDSSLKQLEYNLNDKGTDLSENDFDVAQKDYDREEKEGNYKEVQDFTWVKVKK